MELCSPQYNYLVCTQLQIIRCPYNVMNRGVNFIDEYVQTIA